jgi:pimeloyl-ACP methyl ester carboxylesterase
MIRLTYAGADGCPLYAFSTHVPQAAATTDLPVLILMHGGGPDHRSLVPLARRLSGEAVVVLPDVRGYGRSVCTDSARHTWAQYAADVVSLLDYLHVDHAVVGGAGLGATVSLRTAVAHPDRVSGLVLISVEDVEDDAGKEAEIAFMEAFAERMRTQGVEAAWAPILGDLSPIIGTMVREAMADANPGSLAAAAAIGHDRAFCSVDELLGIQVPTLLFAGSDWRHPATLAKALAERLPHGCLAKASMSEELKTTDDFARAFAPEIAAFLRDLRAQS